MKNNQLNLSNTITGKRETFVPINPKKIGMYVCGPTVYDFPHVGNARPLVVFDVLYSCLLYTSPSPRDATLSRMPSSA